MGNEIFPKKSTSAILYGGVAAAVLIALVSVLHSVGAGGLSAAALGAHTARAVTRGRAVPARGAGSARAAAAVRVRFGAGLHAVRARSVLASAIDALISQAIVVHEAAAASRTGWTRAAAVEPGLSFVRDLIGAVHRRRGGVLKREAWHRARGGDQREHQQRARQPMFREC